VTDDVAGNLENEGYHGEAVEKLAKFENLYDCLIMRHSTIPGESELIKKT